MLLTVLLTTIHILVCLVLIGVVLLQTGKRADLAGAFGGGGSQTAFGARGAATFLSRATTISAVIFMMTSFGLALLQNGQPSSKSVLDEVPSASPAPVVPAPPAPGTAPAPGGTPLEPGSAPAPATGPAGEPAPAAGTPPTPAPEPATGSPAPAPGSPAPAGGQGN